MPPTHRGGWNYSGLEPCARDGMRIANFFDVKLLFYEKEKAGRKGSEKASNAPVGETSCTAAVVGGD